MSESSSQLSVSSSGLSVVSQEVGVVGGRSEVILLHSHTHTQPSTSEPMELALSPTDVHEHTPLQLVIGSSSSSVVRQFSQNRSSSSTSSATQITASSSSSAGSGSILTSSSSSYSSSSALVHMASTNMVEEVARMEVSTSPHPSSPPTHSGAGKAKQPNAKTLPVQIGMSYCLIL